MIDWVRDCSHAVAFRRNGAKIIFWLCMDAQCKQINNFEKIIDEIKITGCNFYFGEKPDRRANKVCETGTSKKYCNLYLRGKINGRSKSFGKKS